jgi:Protein of unknown function (DUF4242)
VAEFVLEFYVSRTDTDAVARGAKNVRKAAEQLTQEGKPVEYVHSIFIPEDETCFHVYEAVSADAVREAARRAALPFDRVAEAVVDAAETG